MEFDSKTMNQKFADILPDEVVKTSKKMQYFATMVVCLGAVSAGTALAWTSPVLPQISAPESGSNETSQSSTDPDAFSLQLTLSQQTWVGSLLAIGAFLAAIPTGYIADAIGRRYTSMIMCVPSIVAWICSIFAKSAVMLYIARFTIGFATGSFCVVTPMYISEIAEDSIRGRLGTLFQLLLTIGVLLVYLIGAVVSWTTLSVFCLMVPVSLLISMIFLPETPTYLLKKGRSQDAALSLKWLWGRSCDFISALQQIQTQLDRTSGKASIIDLLRIPAARKSLLISMLMMFFQQFSGVNTVIFYTVPIFKSAGSTLNPSICSIIVGVVQVIMTFISSLLIEKAGRKSLLLFSSTAMSICLASLGAYFYIKDSGTDVTSIGWLPLVCVVMFMGTFAVGYGPIPWLLMGELLLPQFKGIGVALTVMTNWISVFCVTKSFGSMIEAWGSDITFWFFASCMFVATVFVALCVMETKGKSSAQIQMWLDGVKQ